MVDESLKAHLTAALTEQGRDGKEAREQLGLLLGYTDEEPSLSETEIDALLEAIHTCKILDPACGSGAFPIGMLNKLLHVVQKLDPHNDKFEAIQIANAQKIEDRDERRKRIQQIGRDFSENNVDYGRKLYLIENCLYGVDIQPIAIQISKLRFFISLICDQKTNRDKAKNHGIRTLPNLETKFVAADTLIGLPKMDQLEFVARRAYEIEDEIESLYHRHFTIQRRDQKQRTQDKVKELRKELGRVLAESLGSSEKGEKLAEWDPFDPQANSDFFDPHWMFGRSLTDGFDVVIGNPPYVFGGNAGISREDKARYKKLYLSGSGKINLFAIFIERGSQLLKAGGVLSYILPNTLLRVTSYSVTRNYILKTQKVEEIVDLDVGVFDQVTASTIIIQLRNTTPTKEWETRVKHGHADTEPKKIRQSSWRDQDGIIDIFSSPTDRRILELLGENSTPLGELCHRIRFGVVISGNINEVVSDVQTGPSWKPFLEGDEISSYATHWRGRFLNYSKSLLHRSRTPDIFECRKIMIQRITGGDRPLKATLDDEQFYNKESLLNLILKSVHTSKYEYILALLNSSTINWFYRKRFTNASKLTVNLSKGVFRKNPCNASLGRPLHSSCRIGVPDEVIKKAYP